jgi:predicted RNase H-like nuclease (RuvC/YqgF family)
MADNQNFLIGVTAYLRDNVSKPMAEMQRNISKNIDLARKQREETTKNTRVLNEQNKALKDLAVQNNVLAGQMKRLEAQDIKHRQELEKLNAANFKSEKQKRRIIELNEKLVKLDEQMIEVDRRASAVAEKQIEIRQSSIRHLAKYDT